MISIMFNPEQTKHIVETTVSLPHTATFLDWRGLHVVSPDRGEGLKIHTSSLSLPLMSVSMETICHIYNKHALATFAHCSQLLSHKYMLHTGNVIHMLF